MEPPPARLPSTLPALMEELIEEILIRIPPDEPAHLVRAALVCKPWRRIILSDPGFLRRYRAFHRRHPPLLGFFYNGPSFMPACAAFPNLPRDYRCHAWWVHDCRHGRVLLENMYDTIIVWDPISDDWQELQAHDVDCNYYCITVLCAVAGCDHHDCRGGPFLVVYLSDDSMGEDDDAIVSVCVYSSEARAWGTTVSYQLGSRCHLNIHRAAVIGDEIYCVVTPGARIIKYDLVKHCISSFSSPSIYSDPQNLLPSAGDAPVLMQNEDGSLGLASVRDSRLYLWSLSRMVVNREGKYVPEWVERRVIELDNVLPIDKPYDGVYVTGFAEGVGNLFLSTIVGTFTFELKSDRVRKISESIDLDTVSPLISFFTPCKAPRALY